MKDFHGNAILFSVGGIVSFYPSKLEFQTPIPGLKGDFVGEALDEAHVQGLKFIARLDLSKCHKHVYESHPEWFYRRVDGQPVIYNGLYSTCINGGYYREYAFEIMKEILDRYDVDGFFFNMFGYQTHDYSGNYHGLCQCVNCQRRLREMFGHTLPGKEDRSDPAYRDFLEFRRVTVDEVSESVRDFIHRRPNTAFLTGAVRYVDILRSESNSAVDRQLPVWQYSGSDNVKRVRGTYPYKPVSNSAIYFLNIPYRFASVSPHLTTLRLAQDLANGGGLDLYVLGTLDQDDKIALEPAREIFRFFQEHEDVYHNLSSLARVCLITGDNQDYRGMFRLLTENHILFDCAYSFILDEDNAEQFLEKYDLLILPGVASLSEEQVHAIDRFVEGGGSLLATGETALSDEKGSKVESDLPGVIKYSYGKGKTAYFPWNVGRLYYRHSSPGHEQAVLSVLLDLRNGERQIVTNAHPLVEIELSTNSVGNYILSLVNSSGHQSTAFFEPVPMHDIEVKMKLPEEVKSAFSLKQDRELDVWWEGEYFCVRLERLEVFDTIVIS